MERRPDELANATLYWLNEACSKLSNSNGSVERVTGIESWAINSDGSFERIPFSLHLSRSLVEELFENNPSWKHIETLALSEIRIADQFVADVNLTPHSWGKIALTNVFMGLLPKPVISDGIASLSYKTPSIERVETFLESLRSNSFVHRTVWPIRGIQTKETLVIEDGLEFRALLDEEKKHLLQVGIVQPFLLSRVPAGFTDWYGLIHSRRVKKVRGSGEWQLDALTEESVVLDFLAAVAITTGRSASHPGGQSTAPRIDYNPFVGGFSSSGTARGQFLFGQSSDPVLSPSLSGDLLFVWSILRQRNKGKDKHHAAALSNAIRRFYYASTRISPEDQLLDLMIAAESIYINDESSEKRFRLSINAAN